MARIDVIHVGILQAPDGHAALARPDGRAALLQAEIPLLGIHEERIFAIEVRPACQRQPS